MGDVNQGEYWQARSGYGDRRSASREVYGNGFEVLAIQANHLDALTKLVFHHKDPFDRLMIAQALAERMPVVTRDEAFGRYPVSILW